MIVCEIHIELKAEKVILKEEFADLPRTGEQIHLETDRGLKVFRVKTLLHVSKKAGTDSLRPSTRLRVVEDTDEFLTMSY